MMREKRIYQTVFATSAATLVACLVFGGVSLADGAVLQACYVLGAVSALVCFHAARKLRCSERATTTADGAWLNDAQGPWDSIGDGD